MKETIDLGKFPKGINNIAPDTDLPEGSLVSAVNVDIDKEGNISQCEGYEQIYSGEGIHSFYKRYFAEKSELKYLEDDNTATVIDSELRQDSYLAWETILGDLYYSDGLNNRIVNKGKWGIPTPISNSLLTESAGLLNAGIYQVALCYRNSETGEIGGAKLALTINISDKGAISCSNMPVSHDGYDIVVYVSVENGTELYQNGIVPNGSDSYTIINSRKSTRILNTQFMEPLPGGHILRHFNARLYVARGNVVWFSEAFRYGLRKTSKNFFQFPSKVTILQPVIDGLFIVADKTYFLQGSEPKDMVQRVVSKHTAIEGTGKTMGGETFAVDGEPGAGLLVGYWFSNTGAVLGMAGGAMKELTDDRFAIPTDLKYGNTTYKKVNGIKQMITSFTNNGNASSFAFGAQATGTIIRNGVVIP
jgi:hypothetical protein